VIVVVGGAAWWTGRPSSRPDICAEATRLSQLLDASPGGIDNAVFDSAATLGGAAQKPDAAAGGNLVALRSAGQQLSEIAGRRTAYSGQFEMPLAQIQSWCAT
jgi:hypothetical protein